MNFIPESKLEELLSDKLDFLFILNMDGNIIETNLAVNSILGYSNKDLDNKNLLTAYSARYKEKIGAIIPLAIKGDVTSCPYPFVTRTGEIVPVNTKFYIGWWKEENVIVAVSTNLSAKYFSKEVFSSIFNGSQIMMTITTIDSNVIFNVNNAFIETLGYSLEEISGKTVRELGAYYNYSEREVMLEQFATKGKAEGEATIKTKSGELLDCLFSFERIKIQDEDYMLAAITNINQRKQMEEKLKHLINQQKLLADVAQFLNKPGDFDDIINTVLRLIGQHSNVSRVYIFKNTEDEQFTSNTHEWCNEGIAGKKDELQMLPFDKVPSWKKILSEEGRIFSENIQELPQDMINLFEPLNIKSVLAYPIYIQSHLWGFMGFDECLRNKIWLEDEMTLLLTVTNNIGNALERKLYLNQFQNSELRLRLALSGAREGMWDWNLQTDKVYFSDTCYTMLGYEPDELLKSGRRWKDLIHPGDRIKVLRIFENHLKNRTDYYESVFRIKDKSGEWRWMLDHGKVIERDKDGKAIRVVGTHIDISKQKKVEQQLQELLLTKDKLFSIIAHDLRGPVGSFMQIIELLTDDINITPDLQASFLNDLKDMSKSTFYLLENLLNWSRSQRSEIVCSPKSIILNELITQNISLLSVEASQKSIGIQFKEKSNYEAYADYDMINLVVRNLLSNAIKFTRPHGLITISLSEQSGFVEVVIADNGVGMSQEAVDNLFIDNQFHSTYGTNNEKGSGLGLVLCKDFVLRNGGIIRVESTLGEGSKFIFTVPLNAR
jgi:PAS domain S-box-containing protein